MREMASHGCPKKRYRVTAQSKHGYQIAPNRFNYDLSADAPNQKWVADITYSWTGEGWLCLVAIVDLYSIAVIGLWMSDRINRQLAIDALQMAVAHRQPGEGLIHRSDLGSQYASGDHQYLLQK